MHTQQSSGESESEGLQGVDANDLVGAAADAFHDGDGIELLLQMGLHGHAYAERADDQRHQAYQAEEHGRALQSVLHDWVGLGVVGDQGFVKHALQTAANALDRNGWRRFKQEALRCAAAGNHEAGAVQRGARHEDARADVQTAGHAIGFTGDCADDAKGLSTDTNGIADMSLHTQKEVGGDCDGVAFERVGERLRRIEFHGAIEGIDFRVDGFHGDEDWRRSTGFGEHGDGLGDPGAPESFAFEDVEEILLFAGGYGESADHEIAGHEGAGFAREHGLEDASEAFHSGETGDSGGYGQDDEEKFGAGRASFTPGDSKRGFHGFDFCALTG